MLMKYVKKHMLRICVFINILGGKKYQSKILKMLAKKSSLKLGNQDCKNDINYPLATSATEISQKRELKRKRKPFHPQPLIKQKQHSYPNKHFWVHLNRPANVASQFGVSTETPKKRNGLMKGCNIYWVKPSGIQSTNSEITEGSVPGGQTHQSHYVTELCKYNANATVLLLTRGGTVDVAFLKPLEEVFEGWTDRQIGSVWPKKKDLDKMSEPDIREIANRVFRRNGGNGVAKLKCLTLAAFQNIVTALGAKPPRVGAVADAIGLTTIKPLIQNFEMLFQVWASRPGNNSHMYATHRAAVVQELADYVRAGDIPRYNAAAALLTSDKSAIDSEVFTMASTKGILATAPTTTPFAAALPSVDAQMYEFKLNRLLNCVNTVAGIISKLTVTTQHSQVCKKMLEGSAYMQWIGTNCVPMLDDMLSACGSDNGSSNDNMRRMMRQRSQDTWYGILCCIVMCYNSKIDCESIMGEGNATGSDNEVSCYDRMSHLGKVKRNTAYGSKHIVPRGFCVNFASILKVSKKNNIRAAWNRIFEEMKTFSDNLKWSNTMIDKTFTTLQIHIEVVDPHGRANRGGTLKGEKNKWLDGKKRHTTLGELKWIFILYMESLPSGQQPTLNNFLTTLMSPMGAVFCDCYLAWLATGVYNLRRRYIQDYQSVPTWIKERKTTTKEIPTILNTIQGTAARLLFRAFEKMIHIEFPPNKTILKSAQDNAVGYPESESHANTALGRCAGARGYWLLSAVRFTETLAPRSSLIDQVRVIEEAHWKKIQPDLNLQYEFRRGMCFIRGQFGSIKLVLAQSKICGAQAKSNSALFDSKKHEVELYTPGGGYHPHYSSLSTVLPRVLDAYDIVTGPPELRDYTIRVKDTSGLWINHRATNFPSPSFPEYSFDYAKLPQPDKMVGYDQLFKKFREDYEEIRNVNNDGKKITFEKQNPSPAHNAAVASVGVQMCSFPPRGNAYHTLANKTSADGTNKLIRLMFNDICKAMMNDEPIQMGNPKNGGIWNLQQIPPPVQGHVVGKINSQSRYTFKSDNVLSKLIDQGFTSEEITALREICRAVSTGDLIVHPSWFGRQTQLAYKIGILFCARQIVGWIIGDSSSDGILNARANAQAKAEGHEGNGDVVKNGSIPLDFYCKSFATFLGNPSKYFEHFDRRVRAHPTPCRFSLENGIESFPSTLVPYVGHDSTQSPLVRALDNVHKLTTREQMQNLSTLAVYRGLLEFIIERQRDFPVHQQCILRWFNERATYDDSMLEQEHRMSPRKKQKKIIKSM